MVLFKVRESQFTPRMPFLTGPIIMSDLFLCMQVYANVCACTFVLGIGARYTRTEQCLDSNLYNPRFPRRHLELHDATATTINASAQPTTLKPRAADRWLCHYRKKHSSKSAAPSFEPRSLAAETGTLPLRHRSFQSGEI